MTRKKRAARVHRVTGILNIVDLTKAGTSLDLAIYHKDRKLGTLVIGRGSISWWGNKRRHEREWNWSEFAALMNRESYED